MSGRVGGPGGVHPRQPCHIRQGGHQVIQEEKKHRLCNVYLYSCVPDPNGTVPVPLRFGMDTDLDPTPFLSTVCIQVAKNNPCFQKNFWKIPLVTYRRYIYIILKL